MSSFLDVETVSQKIVRIFGFMIATYCERREQYHLIQLFPFIVCEQNDAATVLKWRLFESESLQCFIEETSIPIFCRTLSMHDVQTHNQNDSMNSSNIHNDNDRNAYFPVYSPLSVTRFPLKGIDMRKLEVLYERQQQRKRGNECAMLKAWKGFNKFKAMIIMIVIERFYRKRFENKTCRNSNENNKNNASLRFLDRLAVNETLEIDWSDLNALEQQLLNLNFDEQERCVIFNVFQDKNEKFDFMLSIVDEIDNESDLNWFVKQVIDVNYRNYSGENSTFFKEIADNIHNNDGNNNTLAKFTEMLNVLFLVPLRLFNQWIIFHSEEAFLSDTSSKSFMTMDIIIVQGVLTKLDLHCCPCITL